MPFLARGAPFFIAGVRFLRCAQRAAPPITPVSAAEPAGPHRVALEEAVRLPYAELFDEASALDIPESEIAHVTARHGQRLMRRATIASIAYEVARIGALIATGGAIGLAGYYALEYGFYGLGLALSLDLLGVSREFELEADQLGVQYAWNAGYDPAGFIRFFDRMARREGYVRGASWFRTHPPFYQRMVESRREIEFLPAKAEAIVQTPEFEDLCRHLEACKVEAEQVEKRKDRPTLYGATREDCPPANIIDFKAGDPIDHICPAPQ